MARLTRLPRAAIVDPKTGHPSIPFTVYWQRYAEAQEAVDARQDVLISDVQAVQADQAAQLLLIQQAQADLAAQLLLIQAAQATATAAQASATGALREAARISSYTIPSNNLTGTDAGTAASIVIANHSRIYPVQGDYDVPDVAITGATITGLAFATEYGVGYDDAALSNGTPTFFATADIAAAQVGAAAGRHFVGVVTTPADGGADTSGTGGSPPGYEPTL